MNKHRDIDVDNIVLKIQAAARARFADGVETSKPASPVTSWTGDSGPAHGVGENRQMTLSELLALHDEELVQAGYRQILQRPADSGGLAYHLSCLRTGTLSKLEILVAMRFSEEGRRVGVLIPGLTRSYWTARVARVPILGYFFRMLYGIWRLPVLMKNLDTQDAHAAHQFLLIRHRLDEIGRAFANQGRTRSLDQSAALPTSTLELLDRQEVVIQRTAANTVELQQHLARLEFAKANRKELAALDEGIISALSSKADMHQVASLAAQIEAKAERQELAELSDHLELKVHKLLDRREVVAPNVAQNALASTAIGEQLQNQLDRLELAKADRKDLAILEERVAAAESLKAGREDLTTLVEQLTAKAERQELTALAGQVETKTERQEVAALAERLESMGPSKADREELTAIAGRVAQCENSRVDPNQVTTLGADLQTVMHQLASCRQDLHEQYRRLGLFLELARKRLPEAFTTEQLTKLVSEESHFLDSLYVAFEDRFRGNREAILEGLKVYLPYVEKVALQHGKGFPVLDLACGRGEWLELLNLYAHSAKGVDVNRVALQQCQELALDVVEEDAIEFLRKQPKNSFSAVTCFHYVEHIDYRSLVALVDEALRILIPGGVAIIETPNGRNILVSGGDFYRDPTHRNPVFPETLECIAELRGFSESTVYCFNDTRTELIPITKFAFNDLNAYVTISRDIAWIGFKPL